MYPYITIGSTHWGTFGLLLWLAAVCAALVLHRSFLRFRVDADALNIVATVVIAGVLGAKLWHELQDPAELSLALHRIAAPGWSHAGQIAINFLTWFRAGFAWYGGLLAGIAALMLQGQSARFLSPDSAHPGPRIGPVRMLDLAAPAAAVGYGVGRIGCLTSGDGDYGRNTTSQFWGVHLKPDALVPPHPLNTLVLPTPLWEFGIALVIAGLLWWLASRSRPVGWLTGAYLAMSGLARFTVEFWRINPRLYLHGTLSNAQVASLGSVAVGLAIMLLAYSRQVRWTPLLVANAQASSS